MNLPRTLRRIAVLAALLALGGCIWRPPPIPPLASANDSSVRGDSGVGMAADAGGTSVTDQEACDRAARANDGSAPSSVFNNGREVPCGTSPNADAAATPDATLFDAAEGDVTVSSDAGSDAAGGDSSINADASGAGDANDASDASAAEDASADDAG